MKPTGTKLVAQNRRATFDYEILETFEAGLVLTGTEIKSVRANKVSLQQAYVHAKHGEMWLVEANIAEYVHGNRENHVPNRPRKLLLHRRQIAKIMEKLATAGLTCVPLKMYLKEGRAKIEIALARGKKQFDKRDDLAKKDVKRQIQRELKDVNY